MPTRPWPFRHTLRCISAAAIALALAYSSGAYAAPTADEDSREISPFAGQLIQTLLRGGALPNYVTRTPGPDDPPADLIAFFGDRRRVMSRASWNNFLGPFRVYREADPTFDLSPLVPFTVAKQVGPGVVPAATYKARLEQYGGFLFRSNDHNRFFADLFQTLSTRLAQLFVDRDGAPAFRLSERDLFHSHAFYSNQNDAFGLLFHLKEYCVSAPTTDHGISIARDACTDISGPTTCRFDARHGNVEFRNFRNVLWLAKTNEFYVINSANEINGRPNPVNQMEFIVNGDEPRVRASDGLVGYAPEGWPSDVGALVNYCRSIQNIFGREIFAVNYLGGDLAARQLRDHVIEHRRRLFIEMSDL